jgi:hypothetical protein
MYNIYNSPGQPIPKEYAETNIAVNASCGIKLAQQDRC